MGPIRAAGAVLIVLATAGPCAAASLFGDTSVMDVTLEGPLSSVTSDARERGERPFTIRVDGFSTDVDVRLRGKSRAEHCRFPPLRLDFAAKTLHDGPFAGQNKLKLVTHCRGKSEYEQNVLEEYAAYLMLNVLTDMSYRVRLLRVSYVDTDTPGEGPLTRFGFVIESDDALARRIGGDVLKVRDVSRTMLEQQNAALVYVFQYLIGNTDWSLVRFLDGEFCCHNGKLFRVAGRNYYVPYDFDMSGLVNARYARPQPELRLRSVRVRRYRGYCTDNATLRAALRSVLRQKAAILNVLEDLPGLTDRNRLRQSRYIEAFFDTAENKEDKLLREFERRCL